MPELPEVETVRQTLKNFIIGRKVTDVIVRYDGIIKDVTVEEFRTKLANQQLKDIRRLGKYLFFDFENITLTSHLRMEGKYYLKDSLDTLTKHEHIIFVLDNGKFLTYHDVRKFGTMEITDLHKESELKSVKALGMEINDPMLSVDYLYPLLKKSNRAIKSLLLDQHIVCGLGNIYVDETLFSARIYPEKPGSNISIYQVDKIIRKARKVINKAIRLGGTTIRTYQSSLGVDGLFQNHLNVHTLAGEKCKFCNDTILKIRVGGRGTYYCPTCQRNDDTLIIGLTGGIATGKTLVSDWFIKNKVNVLDADKIYKKLLKTNKIMYNEITREFGESVVKDKQIDTSALGKMVFSDKELRLKLNHITHPFVIRELERQIDNLKNKGKKLIILDIPLLYEFKLDSYSDISMLVDLDYDIQIKRLMKRDHIDYDLANKKINSQLSMDTKKKFADIIIDNNHSKAETEKQLVKIYQTLRSDGFVN
ncbi:MAG: DNA-formamidopyrimidine glycosylase [Tenericutes bacterium]|nr:DNA-formamidopyrimidine glycosylase [Mycoplasmatota bacterium]